MRKPVTEVVIFIYKPYYELKETEELSLKQLIKVLSGVSFSFVLPKGLDIEKYKQLFSNLKEELRVIYLDRYHFNDVTSYNRLVLDHSFYRLFFQAKYILIYQTDAWVFSNQLQHWVNKGYDYIGAPWFSSMTVSDPNASITGVGNGGFSLRNTRKMYSILKRVNRLRKLNKIWQQWKLEKIWSFQKMVLRFNFYFKIVKFWELHFILDESPVQEDVFLCFKAASVFSDFNIAPAEEAMQFSFEVNPSLLYKMNHNQLPFGCHAWEKYEPEFWKKFIPFEIKK